MYLYPPPPPTSGQHATADVSLMLLGSKLDLEDRREVSREEGQKVRPSSAYRSLPVAVCLGGSLFVISAWATMTLKSRSIAVDINNSTVNLASAVMFVSASVSGVVCVVEGRL